MKPELDADEELLVNAESCLPQLFVERLHALLAKEDYSSSILSFCNPKPLTIRPNTLQSSESVVLSDVANSGIQTTPVDWCPLCHLVEHGTIRELQELPAWNNGELYIQGASSMLAGHALQVGEEMRVLDMCAAPGSKTSQLAALMNNRGMLVANDRSRKRLYRLREILQRQGATNVEVLCGSGERLGQSHADCFDRVLIDAPCSGEGRFRMDRPNRVSRWSEHEIHSLAKLQEQLLVAALRCVCVGGFVVYSTCTFAPEENEFVLDRVLSRNSIDAEIVEIPECLHPPTTRQPIASWMGKTILNDIHHAIRIIPDNTTTGFFVACLKRLS